MNRPTRKGWLGLVGASAIGIAALLTANQEGTVYKAYPDPATGGAPWTICNGHTQGVRPGDTATPAQCHAWLVSDMRIAAATVDRCIPASLNVNQRAALYDATFNIGPSVVCGSTLQAKARAGNYPGMCAELGRWIYANKKVMRGLINRRVNDIELCNWPVATSETPIKQGN